jgi:hypothetical protein
MRISESLLIKNIFRIAKIVWEYIYTTLKLIIIYKKFKKLFSLIKLIQTVWEIFSNLMNKLVNIKFQKMTRKVL